MKKLQELIACDIDVEVKGIRINSKEVTEGDLFVCVDMGTSDRHLFIDDAINRGACAIIASRDVGKKSIPVIIVDNTNDIFAQLCSKFYDEPTKKIKMIGVTGTDGKTTVTTMLKDMTDGASIGTNGLVYEDVNLPLNNTTPNLEKIYECLTKVVDKKKKNVFMEVSSEAYLTNRIPNLSFDIGVFTNITDEHLDKHKTFENYFNCKMQLLKNSKVVILNHDSKYFDDIKQINSNYRTYGFVDSDLTIKNYQLYIDKTIIKFEYNKIIYDIESPLIGQYNVSNLMAAILVMLELGYKIEEVIKRIGLIKKIPGRNEIVYHKDYIVMIDHAHTINAVKNMLEFANIFKKKRLIVVLGCAGGRYKEKRNEIGKLCFQYADVSIFTSDDPRDENPEKIIDDMLLNNICNNEYYRIVNRKLALKKAIEMARPDDFILVLGRGRDESMYLNGFVGLHNDYEELKQLLKI